MDILKELDHVVEMGKRFYFPDIRYQAVHFFPDLKVEIAEFFPNELGERHFCDRFCDIRNKYEKTFKGIAKY